MAFLIALALRWKWPGWAARLFGWALPVAVVAGLTGIGIGIVYQAGKHSGRQATEIERDKAHTAAVADARDDEHKAAAAATVIASRVAARNDGTTARVRSTITEMHDDLQTPQPPAAGHDAAAGVDGDRLRTSLNALIADANRAADAADAER